MGFTESEKRALELFRPRAENLAGNNLDDEFLIRWLRARELDLDKAEHMLKNCLEWREREIVSKVQEFPVSEAVAENLQWTMSGHDSEGRPIYIFPLGNYEIRRFIQNGLKNDCVQRCRRMLEEMSLMVESLRGQGVTQFVVIMDASGLTFWKIAHLETVNTILNYFREFDSYYPELLYRCYIINAPRAFSYIFNIVKPFLSMRTLGKVTIYDSGPKWRSEINQDLPSASLPIEYNPMPIPVAL